MNNEEKVFQKSNINWLVSIYPTLSKKAYKTMACEI